MSADHDALKGAKEVTITSPAKSAANRESPPVAPALAKKPGPGLTPPAAAYVLVLFAFLVLGVLMLREMNQRIQAKARTRVQTEAAVAASSLTTSPAPAARVRPAKPAGSPGATTQSPGNGAAVSSTTALEAVPPEPAPLKLQAVLFDPARPSAIISGKTVFVGDRIGSFRVAKIDRDSATLEGEGQTKVLKLQ